MMIFWRAIHINIDGLLTFDPSGIWKNWGKLIDENRLNNQFLIKKQEFL